MLGKKICKLAKARRWKVCIFRAGEVAQCEFESNCAR